MFIQLGGLSEREPNAAKIFLSPTRGAECELNQRRRFINEKIATAMAALERDPTADWTRSAIADKAGLSPVHLDRLFRAATGGSAMAYVRRYRLERARRLLRATSLPVTEIGRRCGLPDPAYFGRAYRLHFGVTPGADRQPKN